MDKDKILEKSRKENESRDEMEKQITIEASAEIFVADISFSLFFTLMAGVILYSYNRLHDLPSDTIFIMFWTSCVSNRLYRLTKRKSTSDLVTMIISLVILVFYVVKYFTQG